MIPYPEKLPPPVRDNYSSKYAQKFNRLKMDDGGRRPLPMWADQPNELKLRWNLTWDQLAIFDAWLKYDLKMGAVRGMVPIQGIDREVLFMDDPNRAYNAERGHWEVSVTAQMDLPAPNIPVEGSDAPTWPSSLPIPEKDGYEYVTEGAIHPTLKEGEQDGRMRWRRRRADVKFRVILNPAQKEIFDTFVHDTLAGGLAFFYITLAGGAGTKLVKAQFTEAPITTPLGALFQVDALVDTFEIPELTEFQYRYGDGVTIEETLEFGEHIDLGRVAIIEEGFQFEELVTRSLNVPRSDGIAFTEEVSYISLYRRTLNDGIAFSENVAVKASYRRDGSDRFKFTESGYATTQNYFAEDYFGEDYFGAIVFF